MFPLITDAGNGNLYLHLTTPSEIVKEEWLETKVFLSRDQAVNLLLTLNMIFVMEAPSVNLPFAKDEYRSLMDEAEGKGLGVAELIRSRLGFVPELPGRCAVNFSDEEY